MIRLYDKIRLKSGKLASIVEILEQGKAYIADIELEPEDYTTEQILQEDIASIFVEVEQPFPDAV